MEYIYAALLLHRAGKPVDEEGLKSVLTAAGSSVDDAKVKSLIASLKDVDIDKELENAQVAAVAAPVASGDATAPVAEEKKEEVKTDAAAAGLSALFG